MIIIRSPNLFKNWAEITNKATLAKDLKLPQFFVPLWWRIFIEEIQALEDPITKDDLCYYLEPPFKNRQVCNVNLEV
ncbi:MAG: hypothetical protein HC930_04365 [Hydrococcus sp. SU_1_0]|nr:hypothetical protein [Hydrococcus sp. SU_1_0]